MHHADLHTELTSRFAPVMRDLAQRAALAEAIIDKDTYRILVCTLWVNVVLDPAGVGVREAHLETLHDVLNHHVAAVLGSGETLTSSFRYLNGKAGEQAMKAAHLTPDHRDMLLFFASMILDPDGHRRWMDDIRNRRER